MSKYDAAMTADASVTDEQIERAVAARATKKEKASVRRQLTERRAAAQKWLAAQAAFMAPEAVAARVAARDADLAAGIKPRACGDHEMTRDTDFEAQCSAEVARGEGVLEYDPAGDAPTMPRFLRRR